jgi:hypothetical protein
MKVLTLCASHTNDEHPCRRRSVKQRDSHSIIRLTSCILICYLAHGYWQCKPELICEGYWHSSLNVIIQWWGRRLTIHDDGTVDKRKITRQEVKNLCRIPFRRPNEWNLHFKCKEPLEGLNAGAFSSSTGGRWDWAAHHYRDACDCHSISDFNSSAHSQDEGAYHCNTAQPSNQHFYVDKRLKITGRTLTCRLRCTARKSSWSSCNGPTASIRPCSNEMEGEKYTQGEGNGWGMGWDGKSSRMLFFHSWYTNLAFRSCRHA